MARILILSMLAVVLVGGIIAADQALSNPDVAVDTGNTTQQDDFAAVGVGILDLAPVVLFTLVAGTIVAVVRGLG